ncbi:DUF4340 domain-containing protein [Pontiella sulfatireligans]|uniref:DUF4340 domain-containing protein n=1 Tax=Pontiella sulfatireligans TaxID=2750658 RepID=A0A6C2UJS6_9BACT|nr:DUF4340 domain-containing protein [Pontiella sulfatireligans]VGO20133.1 hypothetical protein SCARR_02194 [Pontiella sulfatireligans]
MKGRTTLVLLASIVVLGAFIWMQQTWRLRTPAKELQRIRMFNLDAGTLVSLQFKRTNTVVECVKEDGVWMTGGAALGMGRADLALIHRLVAGLNAMGKGTTITPEHLAMRGFDESEYGFDHPALEIDAIDNQGRHVWLIGRKMPLGKMVYAKEKGKEALYTIPDVLFSIVPASAGELRDRTLFAGDAPSVRRVEIRGAGGFIQMVKEPQVDWQVQQPVSAPAEPKEVDAYLARLYRLRIEDSEDFIADNVSDFSVYGLQGENRQISLGGVDGSSRMLVLGDEIPDRPGFVYARRADDTSVFALKSAVLDLLNVPVDRFRDASVLAIPAKEVDHVSLRFGDEVLELRMEDGRWMVVRPVAWPADADAVAGLIKTWDEAVIIDYNAAGDAAVASWTFEFGSSKLGLTNQVQVLPNFGKRDGLRILRFGEPAVYEINLRSISGTASDPLTYKNRSIWQLNRELIQKVSVGSETQGMQAIERREDGLFNPVGTNGNVSVDTVAVEKLLSRLSALKTSEYVTYNPRSLDIYGLADPQLELHVWLSGTNELGRVLLIGRETPRGFYSMVKGRDVVFYLDKSLVGSLSNDLLLKEEALLPEMK